MEWTMEKTLQLIEQVSMRPSIWNFTPKDYKNRSVIEKRKDALIEVARYFNSTSKQVEHKLAILRTQYSREKIKMIKSRKLALNDEDIYVSKWFAYKPMSFMMMQKRREHLSKNFNLKFDATDENSTGDFTLSNEDSSFNEFKISHVESLAHDEPPRVRLNTDEPLEPTPNKNLEEPHYSDSSLTEERADTSTAQMSRPIQQQPINNSNNSVTESFDSSVLQISKPIIQQPINNYEKDEFIIFGESISLQLRNLKTKYGRSLAKLNIQKAIFEAEIWEETNCVANISQGNSEKRSTLR